MQDYKSVFLEYLTTKTKGDNEFSKPKNLYDPIHYILGLGGKRIRPVLTLMSCDLFGGEVTNAFDAALAIEMFHNFTLIHDDIMDDASLRRGKETVHEKWDINTGILSGDAMLILANQFLESYTGEQYKKLVSLFNKTALEVCEGQQYDIDFETRLDVSLEEYIKMISYKTAVLLACSLQMGAIISNASEQDLHQIYDFGLNLGVAFQLQDDYLDTFGSNEFGKKIGGDILENKKTYLYLKTLELASKNNRKELLNWYASDLKSEDKIEKVKELFVKNKVPELLLKEIEKYSLIAFKSIDKLSISNSNKEVLINFGKSLMYRNK